MLSYDPGSLEMLVEEETISWGIDFLSRNIGPFEPKVEIKRLRVTPPPFQAERISGFCASS